jgi:hypothetical protein
VFGKVDTFWTYHGLLRHALLRPPELEEEEEEPLVLEPSASIWRSTSRHEAQTTSRRPGKISTNYKDAGASPPPPSTGGAGEVSFGSAWNLAGALLVTVDRRESGGNEYFC